MGATPEHKLACIAVLGGELVRSQSLVLNIDRHYFKLREDCYGY
jgi:hypothetical protein